MIYTSYSFTIVGSLKQTLHRVWMVGSIQKPQRGVLIFQKYFKWISVLETIRFIEMTIKNSCNDENWDKVLIWWNLW